MQLQRLGPIGGEGGQPFDDYVIPADARLTAVHIYADWVIDALRFEYVDGDGALGGNPPVGGLGGSHHVVYLDADEYLIGISGRCGWYVDSLRFHTNKRVTDVYGGQAGGGQEFNLMAPPGQEIAGLFGRSGWYIDSLGVLTRPLDVRAEMVEGAALEAEADAERTASDAEAELDDFLDGVAAEMATEGRDALPGSTTHRSRPLPAQFGGPEATDDATPPPNLDEVISGIEAEIDAERRESEYEQALEAAALSGGRVADFPAMEATLLEWTDEAGEPLDAIVVVRRGDVETEADVDALEEAAVAEAIAVLQGEAGEGTADVAIYTQVDESDEGNVATVLAVAGPSAVQQPHVAGETAVMVVDTIRSENDLMELEQDAVEAALLALEEDLGAAVDDADVTIYMGTTEDETGQPYGAVVAVAAPQVLPPSTTRSATERGSLSETVMQFGGQQPRPQDLQLIEGIGPKIAALLIEHGINDLGQLATTPVERLREILGGGGRRFRLADAATWPRQAALAVAGDWAALTELQTQLKAGRDR